MVDCIDYLGLFLLVVRVDVVFANSCFWLYLLLLKEARWVCFRLYYIVKDECRIFKIW